MIKTTLILHRNIVKNTFRVLHNFHNTAEEDRIAPGGPNGGKRKNEACVDTDADFIRR